MDAFLCLTWDDERVMIIENSEKNTCTKDPNNTLIDSLADQKR